MKLYPTPENRVPEGGICHDVITSDSVHLRAFSVRQTRAKATIFILNGRAEYIERYFETINDMVQRGFAVVSFDWRGQGGSQRQLSDPLRGYVSSFKKYDLDLEAIIGLAKRLDFPEPFYALGHSTGGNILLRALRDRNWFKRAVLSAPLLGLNFGNWPLTLVRVLTLGAKLLGLGSAYLPGYARGPLKREEFQNNPLSSDRVRWNRDMATLEAHPELGVGGATYSWLRAVMQSLDGLRKWPKAQGPSCPSMIIMAGQDRVVSNYDTRRFVETTSGFSLLIIEDSRHEILMETTAIRAKFFAAFDAFMGLET
jgi:lysophospholipase